MSQLHVPCADELQPNPHAVVFVPANYKRRHLGGIYAHSDYSLNRVFSFKSWSSS